jgi:hypothetical protein
MDSVVIQEDLTLDETTSDNQTDIPVEVSCVNNTPLQNNENTNTYDKDIVNSNAEITSNVKNIENTEIDAEDTTQVDNIHNAETQMPLNTSNDTIDGEQSPLSMEVSYDFPSTGKDKVTVLERNDDENLPCTNDTDDVQITCGQIVKNSQEIDAEKKKETVLKENGIDINGEHSPKKNIEVQDVMEDLTNKLSAQKDIIVSITVEDMLADFVDEVNDENKSTELSNK